MSQQTSLFWDNPGSRGRRNASTITERKEPVGGGDDSDRDTMVARLKAEKNQKMIKEIRELKERLAQTVPREQFDAVKQELDQLKIDSLEMEEHARELEEDMSASNVELHKANQKIAQLSEEVKRAKKGHGGREAEQLEFRLQEMERENRALKSAAKQQRVADREAVEVQFQSQITKLKLRLQEQSQANQALQLSYTQLQQKYDAELTNQMDSVGVLRKQLTDERRRNKAEMQRLQEQQDQERAEWSMNVGPGRLSTSGSDRERELQQAMVNLEKQHSTIEADLAKQIDDLKTAMDARERQSQEVIDEVTTQWTQYRRMAEGQFEEFKKRISDFEDGQVEVSLRIEVDGEDYVYDEDYMRQISDEIIDESQSFDDGGSMLSGRSGAGGLRRPPAIRPPPVGQHAPPHMMMRQLSANSVNSAASGYGRGFAASPNQLHPRVMPHSRSVPPNQQDDSWSATIKSKLFNAFAPSPAGGTYPPTAQNGVVAQREHSRRTPRHSPNHSIGSHRSLISTGSQRSIGMRSMRSAGPPIRRSPSPYDTRSVHSDIQRIQTVEDGSNRLQIMMYRRENAKLAEDFKMAQQQLNIITERAKAKYEQLQAQFDTERRKLEESSEKAKARVNAQTQRLHELEVTMREKDAQLFQTTQMNQQLQRELGSREVQGSSSRTLLTQINSYQGQLQQINRELEDTKNARRDLEQHLHTLNSENHNLRHQISRLGIRTGSERSPSLSSNGDSELMEQQVKVLKNQRRVLVKEVRELREQNERLKNMIVAGSPIS